MGVFQFPAPMVWCYFNRVHNIVPMPGVCMGASGWQIDFEGLKDRRYTRLHAPDFFLQVRLHQLFRFAEDGCAYIDSRRMRYTKFARRKHDRHIGVTLLNEVSILSLV